MGVPEGISPKLSAAVKHVLMQHGDGYRPMTLKRAAEQSGLSATLIQHMSIGRIVGCEGVIRFARAFGEDVPTWLDMCGYDDIADFMRQMATTAKPEPNEFDEMLAEVPFRFRGKARESAKVAIKSLIIPLLDAAA